MSRHGETLALMETMPDFGRSSPDCPPHRDEVC